MNKFLKIIILFLFIISKLQSEEIKSLDSNKVKKKGKIINHKNEIVKIPIYYDYQDQILIYYKGYMNKAYDKKTFENYFYKTDKKKLDTLIKLYTNKIKDSINLSITP